MIMGQPSPEPEASDQDPRFTFRLMWEGRQVAGVRRVGRLRRVTEVTTHRDGADPTTTRKLPGRTAYDPITLELGLSHDRGFEQWANNVAAFEPTAAGPPPEPFRRDLLIEVCDEEGQVVVAYKVYRAWVSEYSALPDLDANAGSTPVQRLTLENEGWERDPDTI